MAIFIDSYFSFAILNKNDHAHAVAKTFVTRPLGPVVTTAWILTEVADGLSAPINRQLFIDLLNLLRTDPGVKIIPPNERHVDEAISLFGARLDKGWSLTDCVSFVNMRELGIQQALTGFTALLETLP